ncbi:EamA family transporter RarD [Flavimaricola marinus]|uniref:EamA-like transporter family protein n=1 Tax=Flavimaricola marinus TaxID=1819565 RepID=A0A238LJF2_9RHOB|nr:EamA family transporter RarD [Flavimaricola marinus]SMY09096.1 EamA-like transporter family protein [Flavimaricola marinus]
MTDASKGIAAMVLACVVWGLSPLYYDQLVHVPALEVVSYRTVWSLIFFAAVLALQGRLRVLIAAVSDWPSLRRIALAAVMIGTNWSVFIWSIGHGHATEASLGYYIFPLVAVLLGRVILGEALLAAQWLAVAIACAAVLVLTVGLGAAPWIALSIAATFGLYGLIKKRLDMGPVVSVTAEMLILLPIAVIWIAVNGAPVMGGWSVTTHLLLALSGPLTATPLILFSYAARRVRLSTVGLLQYLNPTLQFGCAVLYFAEPFTPWHGVAFPLIWLALAVYSAASLRQERALRRAASKSSNPAATVI